MRSTYLEVLRCLLVFSRLPKTHVSAACQDLFFSTVSMCYLCKLGDAVRFAPEVDAESVLDPILPRAYRARHFHPWHGCAEAVWAVPFQAACRRHRISKIKRRRLQNVAFHPWHQGLKSILSRLPKESVAIFSKIDMMFFAMYIQGIVAQKAFATQPTHHGWRGHRQAVQH